MREESAKGDRLIALIAARRYGVVSVEQLHGAGLDKRVSSGRLHRIHRRVYAVGHKALNWRGRRLAAGLAWGEGTILVPRQRCVTVRHRIPVTTVQRTIDDLRGAVPPRLVRRARRQAELRWWRFEGRREGRRAANSRRRSWRFCHRWSLVDLLDPPRLREEPGRVVADVVRALGRGEFAVAQ